MRLPGDIVGPHLEARLRRGTVIRFELEKLGDPTREGQTRMKFGVVVNATPGADDILLLLTTSQMEAYEDGRWQGDILRVDTGRHPFFVKETIIVLRQIESVPMEKLKRMAEGGKLTVEGELGKDELQKINEILRASKLIPPRILKQVLV
ncbi:MAG: hypothetical protein ACRD1B_07605 [Thermoanaerobaculia bacterium]